MEFYNNAELLDFIKQTFGSRIHHRGEKKVFFYVF